MSHHGPRASGPGGEARRPRGRGDVAETGRVLRALTALPLEALAAPDAAARFAEACEPRALVGV